MRFGIRFRFAAWLLVVILPLTLASLFVFDRIEDQVQDRVASDLDSVRRLEAARIEDALDGYLRGAETLAAGPHVQAFTAEVGEARLQGTQEAVIADYDGFDAVDAFGELPLQQLATALLAKTRTAGSSVAELQILGRTGDVYGQTDGFDWVPYDSDLIDSVMDDASPAFGNAFRDRDGFDRLGLAVPITSVNGHVVGALVLESRLGPIVDLVSAHEGFGDTREAHITQLDANGDAEFITLLRFERDAAFTKTVPASSNLPANQSLDAVGGTVIVAPDYRDEPSIMALETIETTGWGLVIKIDRAEALAPVLQQTRSLKLVSGIGILAIILGWATLLDPIGRRLRRMADAAARVANGEYSSPVSDRSTDEIGSMANSIDHLAADLAEDIRVRSEIEGRLRRQAAHDDMTGLHNRQFASTVMRDLSSPDRGADERFSLLFLDLDNFKSVNDAYGHLIGDQVLAAVGHRLEGVLPPNGIAARWGGDEFVLILPSTEEHHAAIVADAVHAAFVEPIVTNVGNHQIRFSVGGSTFAPGESIDGLLHRADGAMFEQKQARSGRRILSPSIVRLVERALESESVEVHFQPVMTDRESETVLRGCEALVRIRDEDHRLMQPSMFLAEVQGSQLGLAIDHRVITSAVEQTSQWIRTGALPADFQLGVNCGEALMRDSDAARFITQTLADNGLSGGNLMVEISEKSSFVHPGVVASLIASGVHVAIDDVGLSYSNIDRLLDAEASIAKIDRRWLPIGAQDDPRKIEVLRHLISLCAALDFDVIAEGVETSEQLAVVRSLGVSTYQGFLFSRALPATEFEAKYVTMPMAGSRSS